MLVCVALVALPIEELKEKSRPDFLMNETRLTFPSGERLEGEFVRLLINRLIASWGLENVSFVERDTR
jgi:hypothetical protein